MAERSIAVSYEAIRLWCNKPSSKYAQSLRRIHEGCGDTLFVDEVLIKIHGKWLYPQRAVGQDGALLDAFLQTRPDGRAVKQL
jgi:putative transposase